MIDLQNIIKQKPEVVLRGEYGLVVGDSIIIAPNAKNGKIVILFDSAKQIAAIAHFDSSDKVEENLTNILAEMNQLGSETKDTKCSVMEKESGHSLKEKIQKSFKERIEAVLKENGNEGEINHTTWSGNDFCNVVLTGSGEILIDNTPELMRAAMNMLIFAVEGDERLNNALNPALISELKKIKGSASKEIALKNLQLLKQTPSSIFVKLDSVKLDNKNQEQNFQH